MALGTERDTATNAHDTEVRQQHQQPRRRSRPTRSPSLSRSSSTTKSSKRSPSPIISFHPASLSAENTKGVKNITRKVIKRLEGLGHLEMVDINLAVSEEDEEPEEWTSSGAVGEAKDVEEWEVEKVLYALGKEAMKNSHSKTTGIGNGVIEKESPKLKPNLEIPRKLLHGSIGFFTLYLYVSQGDVRTTILVLWMALAVIVPADLLRFKSQTFERLYERFLGFLMRESEKNSINGVVWYILGVNFALSFYPLDVATVAILILSWADTAASTIGRLFGSLTPKLPSRVPFLRLPLAPRKSLAGFLAASVTGACIAFGFWGWVAGMRNGGRDVVWSWDQGVRNLAGDGGLVGMGAGGPIGLLAISLAAGVISGVAEALDLGSIDDNLSLPIISGCCILGFIKLLGLSTFSLSSWFS